MKFFKIWKMTFCLWERKHSRLNTFNAIENVIFPTKTKRTNAKPSANPSKRLTCHSHPWVEKQIFVLYDFFVFLHQLINMAKCQFLANNLCLMICRLVLLVGFNKSPNIQQDSHQNQRRKTAAELIKYLEYETKIWRAS